MNIIYADYNIYHNNIDICTYAGYIVERMASLAKAELSGTNKLLELLKMN